MSGWTGSRVVLIAEVASSMVVGIAGRIAGRARVAHRPPVARAHSPGERNEAMPLREKSKSPNERFIEEIGSGLTKASIRPSAMDKKETP